MRRTLLLALAVLLPLGAPAGSLLDRTAPAPVVTEWVQGDRPPDWKRLDGRSALFELLDPDDLVSEGLVSRTVEIAARTAERPLLVVSVCTGAGGDPATARGFAKRAGITWTLGADARGATWGAAGFPTLPWYLLLAPDGRVVWEGNPATLDDATLDTFLERARLWRPDEVAKAIRPAAAAFAKGDYGKAHRLAGKALEDVALRERNGLPVEGTEKTDARVVFDGVGAMATMRMERARHHQKQREALEAMALLDGLEKGFRGTEWEDAAKALRKAMEQDARLMHELEQQERLVAILKKATPLTRRNVERTIESLENFLEFAGNLVAGERARREIARLRQLLDPASGGR